MIQTILRWLSWVVPPLAGSFTAAIMLGPLQPPPTAPMFRTAALMAVFLNVALAFAVPACFGVLRGGTLAARILRALAYGVIGAGAHCGIVIAAGLLQRISMR